MVKIDTLSKVLGVIDLFDEAKPYDIYSLTLMNYQTIRQTLKVAHESGCIKKTNNSTVALSEFGETFIKHFPPPAQLKQTFDMYRERKKERMSSQVEFLDKGKKDVSSRSDKTNKSKSRS